MTKLVIKALASIGAVIMDWNLMLAVSMAMFSIGTVLTGCAPTVSLQAPEKPLEINLNVKIDHQISVKVDKQLDDVMTKNEDIF